MSDCRAVLYASYDGLDPASTCTSSAGHAGAHQGVMRFLGSPMPGDVRVGTEVEVRWPGDGRVCWARNVFGPTGHADCDLTAGHEGPHTGALRWRTVGP
ncbi:MAG: hypothetical protein JWO67_37 [Streptosporangiaceae bacterium]|nr:hypothetical protein [Streptosporangiaceae bacterium]